MMHRLMRRALPWAYLAALGFGVVYTAAEWLVT
jgi:hypothetical protein